MCKTMNKLKNYCYNSSMINDGISSVNKRNTCNLRGLLEILNTNTDVDVHVKLFSMLSACLMINGATNIESIVAYNPIYDKISTILANCPPRKTVIVFNFLLVILYVDDDDHRSNSLVVYAKNMIRSSGCLATMCELFTSCMMNQEAWRALCRCLAESCRDMEVNQSYCTHLVPICIQRCNLRNTEVLIVLQSLLQNHNRNINLFLECNGISLFQRDFLQLDICLQLLATITQGSTAALTLIAQTDICQQLRDFLQLYGTQSELGQWATIVLYHASKRQAPCEEVKDEKENKEDDELGESFLKKLHSVNQNLEPHSANTTVFFKNVMKEIYQCGVQKEILNSKSLFPAEMMTNKFESNDAKLASRTPRPNISQRQKPWIAKLQPPRFYSKNTSPNTIHNYSFHNNTKELSFSFLQKQHLNSKHTSPKNFVTADNIRENFQRTLQTCVSKARKDTAYESQYSESCLNTFGTSDFKPMFASTPKRGFCDNLLYEQQCTNNHKPVTLEHSSSRTCKSIQKSRHQRKQKLQKKGIPKHLERTKINKEIKHKSLSGRLFDAINTSCTTIVRTVKNIFRPKSDLHETEDGSSNKGSIQDTLSCSYSFTNYMRKRDAILKNDYTNKSVDRESKENFDFSMDMTNSCNTCNDTVTLRRKLVNDAHLKQTIRKLKLGINLYGCDFKKISRTMWPKDCYMTPAVLYNLYRKLIIK